MIYTSAEVSNDLEHISLTSTIDLQAVTRFVNDVVASAFPGHVAQGTDDLFGLGLNSVQTMEVIGLLKAGIRSQDKNADISCITMSYIYHHPTIAELAHTITQTSRDGGKIVSNDHADVDVLKRRAQKMNEVLERHTKDLPPPPSHSRGEFDPRAKLRVILTGSTGSLGT